MGIITTFLVQVAVTRLCFLFSRSVVSDALWPHGLRHTRLPCPSRTPGAYSNSCPLSQWCHLTILSSVPLLLLPSIFTSIGVFLMSQRCASGGQSIGASASASVLPTKALISFRIDWFDFLAVQEILKSLLQYHSSKASIIWCSAFFMVQLSHPYLTTGKTSM